MTCSCVDKARQVRDSLRQAGATEEECWGAATVANYLAAGFIGGPLPQDPRGKARLYAGRVLDCAFLYKNTAWRFST